MQIPTEEEGPGQRQEHNRHLETELPTHLRVRGETGFSVWVTQKGLQDGCPGLYPLPSAALLPCWLLPDS